MALASTSVTGSASAAEGYGAGGYGEGGYGDSTDSTSSSLAVSTGGASNVDTSSATLDGSLDDLGGADSADCYIEYRQDGATTWTASAVTTLASTGTFSDAVTGLESGTAYEFQAVAETSERATGAIATFTTDTSEASNPAVDTYSVTEANRPNPHAEITADWAVSDADGDLVSVEVDVLDTGGSLVASSSSTVSGAEASGTDQFKLKKVRDQSFEVDLTVTDAAGNTTSQTATVTE